MGSIDIVDSIGRTPVEMALSDAYVQAPWIHGSLIRTQDGIVWSAYTSRNGQQAFRRVTNASGRLLRTAPSGLREVVTTTPWTGESCHQGRAYVESGPIREAANRVIAAGQALRETEQALEAEALADHKCVICEACYRCVVEDEDPCPESPDGKHQVVKK